MPNTESNPSENSNSPPQLALDEYQDDASAQAAVESLDTPKFLHPSSIVFDAISKATQFIVPMLIGIWGASTGGFWGIGFAIIYLGGSLAASIFRYFTLQYCIRDNEFILKEGLVFRRVRSVPLHRIQNVDLIQNPLHRIFGVAEVNIETASGTKPEATLRVLTHHQVRALREAIFGNQSVAANHVTDAEAVGAVGAKTANQEGGAGEQVSSSLLPQAIAANTHVSIGRSAGTLLYSIPTWNLVKAGLTSNRGIVLLGILAGFFLQQQSSFYDEDFDWRNGFWRFKFDNPWEMGGWFIVGCIGLLILLRFLGIGWYVLRFYGYQLSRVGEDLRISCGLFTKVSATVPRKRVQFISVHRNIFMRWFGFASIRIETAGGAADDNENAAASVSRKWFLPVVEEAEVPRILSELKPQVDWKTSLSEMEWHGVSPLTKKRLTRLSFILASVVSVVGFAASQPWGALAGPALLPLFLALAKKKSLSKKYGRASWGIAYQSGILMRKMSFAFYDRIQALQLRQSPFDRRWKMAVIEVDTAASGPAEHRIEIPYLDATFAFEQFSTLQTLSAKHRPTWG